MRRSAAHLVLVASLAACGEVPSPRHCASSADCAADARCTGEVCVADAPPVAVITAPASFLSNVSYSFGSSGSYDPDAGDSVVSRQWTVTAAQAPCRSSPDAAATESLVVVFPCAGSFDVKLVVVDQLGVPGAPRVLRVSVTQSVDPPAVAVGAELALDHRCAGDPLTCTPIDGSQATTFSLSAAGSGPAAGGFTYRWTYRLPPELAGKPAPVVTFSPGEASPAPVVAVQTQGTAIAGTWQFVVEATDSRGLVAVGTQRVAVGNRPPEVQGAGAALIQVPHVFSPSSAGASTGTMAALGATPVLTVTDPDGDPFDTSFGSSHSGDGANGFLVQDLGDHATFSVVVLYGGPADGAYLIGPGVSRTVSFAAVDANGGTGSASWEIQVTNRPPRLVAPVAAVEVPHSFDAGRSRYLATATLSAFTDDDGDPLSLDAATGDPICAGTHLVAAAPAAAEVECAVPYAGTPAANAIAGLHAVTATVRDAWAGTPAPTNVTVGNRQPRLTSTAVALSSTCTSGGCCLFDPLAKVCDGYYMTQGVATGSLGPPLTDEDGDPMLVTYAAQGSCVTVSPPTDVCVPGSCGVDLSLCGKTACAMTSSSGTISLTATDGDLSLATTFTVSATCG